MCSTSRRNIVLVTVDSLRADFAHGDNRPELSAIPEFQETGITFSNAIAPGPATYESMPVIFTGYPFGSRNRIGGVSKQTRIRSHLESHLTLPERLRQMGYTTIGVSPNPFTSRQYGFSHGFDMFEDFLTGNTLFEKLRSRLVSRWMQGRFVGGLRFMSNMLGKGDVSISWEQVVESTMDLLDGTEPFFIWVMLLDVHWPYQPPSRHNGGVSFHARSRANWVASNFSDAVPTPRDTEWLKTLYRGTVIAVDECLRRLRDELESLEPIFLVTADHGEAFGEHGVFGHGDILYEETIHVPLILSDVYRSVLEKQTVTSPVSLAEMPELITSIGNGRMEPNEFTKQWVYSQSERGDVCVRGEDWKYYQKPDGSSLFFNLSKDRDERNGIEVPLDELSNKYISFMNENEQIFAASDQQEMLDEI